MKIGLAFANSGPFSAPELMGQIGNSNAVGELGGYGPRGLPLAGTFYGRSGGTREITSGVRLEECRAMLRDFFLPKRKPAGNPDGTV